MVFVFIMQINILKPYAFRTALMNLLEKLYLGLNVRIQSVQHFCSYLEYHLTRTFANIERTEMNRLWCDGIALPITDSQLLKKSIHATHCIVTKAWIGYDGQDEYEMTIRFETQATDTTIRI